MGKCEPYNGPEPPLELDPSANHPTMRCGYGWHDAENNCHPSCDLTGNKPCIGEEKDGVAFTCFDHLSKYACDPATTEPKTQDCCFWGIGAVQTTGACNVRLFDDRWGSGNPSSPYSDIDFCAEPNQICDGPPAVKWLSGLDFWKTSVQGATPRSHPDYDYQRRLKQWVDGGMNINDTSFIDEVSGLVNRGCPENACDGRAVDDVCG